MLDFSKNQNPKPKCFFTNTKLSNFLNHEQPPSKKRPFSTILNQQYSHTLDIILPHQAATTLQTSLTTNSKPVALIYARIHAKLQSLLTGPFFTTYIKTPSPTSTTLRLLSQGRSGIDNTFSLSSGILTLNLDNPTYERCGIPGGKRVSGAGGNKHAKGRWQIEVNLRLPSMVQGKPGFERVLWACKNVLNESVTWLVSFLGASGGEEEEVWTESSIAELAPLVRKVEPEITEMKNVRTPIFPKDVKEEDFEDCAEILEWLGMAALLSPRVDANDDMDPYLSRYQIPNNGGSAMQGLVRFHWHGFIPPEFAHKTFLESLRASGKEWVAMTASSFTGEAYTVLVHDGHALSWEYQD